jgi:hypothetical protein
MVSEGRTASAETRAGALDDCLRSALSCQLACIACADACLQVALLKPHPRVVQSCLACLETCKYLTHAVSLRRPEFESMRMQLLVCIDACATCEAECLAQLEPEACVERCRSACRAFRERCQRLLVLTEREPRDAVTSRG